MFWTSLSDWASNHGHFWRSNQSDSASYVNNRRAGFGYDAEGNATITSGGNRNDFDAANKETSFVNWRWTVGGSPTHPTLQPVAEIAQNYSGDGEPAKRIETRRTEELIAGGPNTNITETSTTTFFLYSSVLGTKVVELDANGVKTKGYVYANGERLAKQEIYSWYSAVTWTQANAATNSWIETGSLPIPVRQEMDPVGAEVGTADPFVSDPNPNYLDIKGQEPLYIDGGDPFDYSGGYEVDGLPVSASEFRRKGEAGALSVNISGSGVSETMPLVPLGLGVYGYDRPAGRRGDEEGGRLTWDIATFSLADRKRNKQRTDLPDYIHRFYEMHQGTIDRCVNRVFGQKADGSPDVAATVMPRQTISNAPELDPRLMTQSALQAYTDTPDTLAMPSLFGNLGHGTVYIASDLYEKISEEERVRGFFHEMGNIIAGTVSKTETGSPDWSAFGNPNGIGIRYKDKDTGARFEECIFGSVPF